MASSNTTLQNSPNISERIAARRAAYGGSDDTAASFNRPQYVRYNAISKSRDFGRLDNLSAEVSGLLGGEAGTQTLFFKVSLQGDADVRITKIAGNPKEDQYISVGVIGPDGKPLPLDDQGFVSRADIHGTEVDEAAALAPPGTYVFTVSSSQWQAIPFAALLQVVRYKELLGEVSGELSLIGRLAMARLVGSALMSDQSSGSIVQSSAITTLEGDISGGDATTGSLTIPSGTITGTMELVGRLRVNWRVSGSAGGSLELAAELSVTSSGGGGGGYG